MPVRRLVLVILAAAAALSVAGCGSSDFRCKTDFDCDGTDLCRVATGECLSVASIDCREDRDCVDPRKTCRDYACVLRCVTDPDCGDATQVCVDGACQAPAPTADR